MHEIFTSSWCKCRHRFSTRSGGGGAPIGVAPQGLLPEASALLCFTGGPVLTVAMTKEAEMKPIKSRNHMQANVNMSCVSAIELKQYVINNPEN